MAKIIKISLLLTIVLTLFLTVYMAHIRKPIKSLPFDFVLKPGMHSYGRLCNHSYSYEYYENICHLSPDINYTTDNDYTIKSVNYWIFNYQITLGDLMVHFDRPVGYTKPFGHIWCIYWKDKSVWVIGNELLPSNRVGFIILENTTDKFDPWQGFLHE